MIAIETDVPLPMHRAHCRAPFKTLDVGQSFFVPNGNPNSLSVMASRTGKTLNRTFRTAKQPGGVRVWRVA